MAEFSPSCQLGRGGSGDLVVQCAIQIFLPGRSSLLVKPGQEISDYSPLMSPPIVTPSTVHNCIVMSLVTTAIPLPPSPYRWLRPALPLLTVAVEVLVYQDF